MAKKATKKPAKKTTKKPVRAPAKSSGPGNRGTVGVKGRSGRPADRVLTDAELAALRGAHDLKNLDGLLGYMIALSDLNVTGKIAAHRYALEVRMAGQIRNTILEGDGIRKGKNALTAAVAEIARLRAAPGGSGASAAGRAPDGDPGAPDKTRH